MTASRYIPRQTRRELYIFNPECAKCGATEDLEIDHVIPLALGGENALSNLQILCNPCHKEKTVRDVKLIAKVRRLQHVRFGTAKKRWRRKVNGDVVFE